MCYARGEAPCRLVMAEVKCRSIESLSYPPAPLIGSNRYWVRILMCSSPSLAISLSTNFLLNACCMSNEQYHLPSHQLHGRLGMQGREMIHSEVFLVSFCGIILTEEIFCLAIVVGRV
jgi:hypothetical protein